MALLSHLVESPRLYIGGEHIEAAGRRTFEAIDPATATVWNVVPAAEEADVDAAVCAAHRAFEVGWGRSLPAARRKILLQLADLVEAHAQELAAIESRDNGKSLRESLGEMAGAAMWYRYYAGVAETIGGQTMPTQKDMLVYTAREPYGVVAGILPWNSPLMVVAWKLGPALATGNTAVLKPAEQTSVSALVFAHLLDRIDLPPGVVNFITGGRATGHALVSHPLVRKIAFTGSTDTGRRILRTAADKIVPVSLELGGKSPQIVFDDADIDRAAAAACSGVFAAAGQTCVAGSRVLIQRRIFGAFLSRYIEKASAIRVGHPLSLRTQMGAQISAEQLSKIELYTDLARAGGADILCGGRRLHPEDAPDGYFYAPTVVAGVPADARVVQEEIFGPVAVALPFDSDEEAVHLANNTVFGLAAGIWTRDIKRAHRVASRLQAGTVWINTYRRLHCSVPFGGYKASGFGRESGSEVVDLFTQVKAVWVDLAESSHDPFEGDGPIGPAVGGPE